MSRISVNFQRSHTLFIYVLYQSFSHFHAKTCTTSAPHFVLLATAVWTSHIVLVTTITMLRNSRLFSTSAKDRLLNIQSKLSDNVLSGYNQLKGSLIQAMAHRMNAKDKAELIQFWGEDAKGVDTFVDKSVKSTETAKPSVRVLPTPKFELNGTTEESTLFHPVLGEKLVDLGYKALYLTNVRSLATAPIWKKQRILRPERAQLIANDKIKNNLGSSVSGSISFFLDKKTKEIGIIDGQHRAGALMILAQKGMHFFR